MNTIGGTAGRGRITLLVMLLGVLFALPSLAHAATLFVTPSTGQFAVGQTFDVVVRVNSQGTSVNASEGVLSFNPAQLQVQAITSTGSIFNLNVQQPEYSNTAGTVKWTGVILNPGYTGSSGNLITVRFKGVVPGTTTVSYSSGAVLANDGSGTNVIGGMTGGTYTIGPSASPTLPTPTPTSGAQETPAITSPTHPDPLLWMSNNDPLFQWQLPGTVNGVSYIINPKPAANPGNASDGLVSEVKFTDVPEGAAYFHVKFRTNGAWGPTAHFPFNVDTIQPDQFTIIREDGADVMNPRPLLSFSATDSGSGVVKYMMKIGDGSWFEAPESSQNNPYALPLQAPGTRLVTVEAVDRAGNSTQATLSITIVPITQPVITDYPASEPSGTGFSVSGTADPLVTVRLEAVRVSGVFGRLLYNDRPSATLEVTSDAAGHWAADVPGLESGEYRLTAVAIDSRGALSYPSEPVYVEIGFGLFTRIAGFLIGLFGSDGWFVWLLRAVVFFLLMMLVAAWAHCGDWRFWVLADDVRSTEREEISKLGAIAADMHDELVLIEKVGRHRPLYPEEKYLKSKLLQYRRSIGSLLKDTHSRLAKKK